MNRGQHLLMDLINSVNIPLSADGTIASGDPFSDGADFHIVIRLNGPDKSKFPHSVGYREGDPTVQTMEIILVRKSGTLVAIASAIRKGVEFDLDLNSISNDILQNAQFVLRPADGEHRTLELIDLWERVFPIINAEYAYGRSSRVSYEDVDDVALGITGRVTAVMQ